VELFLLHFHPMLAGLDTFARKVLPLLPRIGAAAALAQPA